MANVSSFDTNDNNSEIIYGSGIVRKLKEKFSQLSTNQITLNYQSSLKVEKYPPSNKRNIFSKYHGQKVWPNNISRNNETFIRGNNKEKKSRNGRSRSAEPEINRNKIEPEFMEIYRKFIERSQSAFQNTIADEKGILTTICTKKNNLLKKSPTLELSESDNSSASFNVESACATHQPYSDVQHIELNDESRINNQFEENISFDLIQNEKSSNNQSELLISSNKEFAIMERVLSNIQSEKMESSTNNVEMSSQKSHQYISNFSNNSKRKSLTSLFLERKQQFNANEHYINENNNANNRNLRSNDEIILRHSLINLVMEEDIPILMETMSEEVEFESEDFMPTKPNNLNGIIRQTSKNKGNRRECQFGFSSDPPNVFTYIDEITAINENQWKPGEEISFDDYRKLCEEKREKRKGENFEIYKWRTMPYKFSDSELFCNASMKQLSANDLSKGVTSLICYIPSYDMAFNDIITVKD
ncbi:unnamed protein product [Dracunculus medinensis]|uniref:DNA replication ATP-dependent helicase/nuclease n=1 Tax=Dracunculus medinensis TaxID=318479 RepID=A0A0N4UDJ4_DRAME|nr:unnamed protein product [Dracunculus medinensis]